MKSFFVKLFKRNVPVIYKRRGVADRIIFGVAFAIFLAYALSIVLFFGWAVMASFKTQNEIIYSPLALPKTFNFDNYKLAVKMLRRMCDTSVLGMIFNGAWYAFGGSFLYIFFHLCTSYIFAKFDFKAKKFMFFLIVLYMLLPLYGSGGAMYKLIYSLNIDNSPLYLLTFAGGFTGSTFLILSAAWETVDKTYSEAAAIDGASQWQTYIILMVPMVLGSALALFILQFIANWNQYQVFILYLDKFPNVAYGIYYFGEQIIYKSNDPAFFAAATMVMIPILIFFAFFANRIMESISFGTGIKG